ncbi:tRNA lysidine(34) synthetase TilS [Verrucomicrobiota bacterium]
MSIIATIRDAIETHALIEKGQRVIVGVSGGADSVALLYVLHFLSSRLGFEMAAAHLHHGTRAEASDADMRFVQELCWRLGIHCFTREVDVPKRAKRSRRSLEMEARAARHGFFADMMQRTHADAVVLAHTADDQAETFLLKLARGAGLRGLSGMNWDQALRGFRTVRPMLGVTRAEIEEFLNHHGLKWREDASNTDLRFKRNCVRHEVLPFLEEKLNPNIRQTLLRTMDVLREEDEWVSGIAASYLKSVSSPTGDVVFGDRLAVYSPAARRRVIMNWLLQNDVPRAAVNFECVRRVDDLLLSQGGSRHIQVTDKLRVVNQYGKLRVSHIKRANGASFEATLEASGVTWVPRCRLEVKVEAGRGIVQDVASRIGEFPSTAAIDLEKVGERTLIVRSIRDGDRMRPLGMSGSRKLQDILVDEKVPRDLRRELPVVECEGEIVWFPGYRISEDWKVRNRIAASLHLTMIHAGVEPEAAE